MLGDRRQLEESIVVLENQRAILGDAVVDSSLALIREKLSVLDRSVIVQSGHEGERKLVTVMFADISGFTALSEKLEPERVRALVNACFTWLVPVIEKYGGVVEQFIGDEVMAMFGAPLAHENDAERALRAALEMMDAIDAFNKKHQTSLGMHIGINTGVVVAGGLGSDGRQQYGVMGDAVNVAARLEDVSENGQIIVGPNTHRLTTSLFKFEMLPPVRVKGKSEPIPIHRLSGLKPVPDPTRGTSGLSSPLVGRTQELETLLKAVASLTSQKGSVLSILAEAGLGKSRLVSEAHSTVHGSVLWVEGRALSYAEGIGYWAAGNLLDMLIGATQESSFVEIDGRLRAFVQHILPDKMAEVFPYLARLRDLPLDSDSESILKDIAPEALQQRMCLAFADLIRACANEQPLVMVWEDLHWADPSSLRLLETLLPLTRSLPLVILLVFRPHEGRAWDWHKRISSEPGEHHQVLELAPLSQSDSAQLVENLLQIDNLPEITLQLILNKSEGNPFFLEELLRSLIDTGMVLLEGDRAVATQAISQLQVPDTLQGVIAARIDRLPSEDKYTLQTASVIGRVFQQNVLGYLLQRQQADVPLDSALNELQQREFIRWRGELEYIFKHAITRDVTYNSLLIERRQELHRSTAETIEMLFPAQLDELAPTLAYHYEAAQESAKAVHYFIKAGDRARQTYANQEAIAFYRAAIQQSERLEDKEKLLSLYENLGMVLSLIGQVDDSIGAYEKALTYARDDDVITRARLSRRQGNAYNVSRRLDEMDKAYERAFHILGPWSPASIQEWIDVQFDRIWARYFLGRMPELLDAIEESQKIIEEYGTIEQKARLFESLVLVDLRRFRYYNIPEQTLTNAKRQLDMSWHSSNRQILGRAKVINGFVRLWREELEEAEKFFLDGLKDIEAVGDVETHLITSNYMALVGRKRGDVDLARKWAENTIVLAQKAENKFYRVSALGSLAWVEYRSNNDSQASVYLQEALALQKNIPSAIRFMANAPALAVEVRNNNWNLAVELARDILDPSQPDMPEEVRSILEQAVEHWGDGNLELAGSLLKDSIELMKQKNMGFV
jgi:class 3 adenylate cyclase/tetratricopeptide (TPR) repeat protein